MFFRYPLRVISSILVGIVFLLQFVFFGQAVLGGRYSALLEVSTGMGDYILKSLPIVVASLIAFLGFGFVFAGLVMMLKNIGPFAQIFEFAMLFFSGVFFPLNVMPKAMIAFSKLFPLTHAAAVVRGLFVGKGYLEVWGEVAWLLVLIPVYWGIGYLIFKWAERITRVIGYGGY